MDTLETKEPIMKILAAITLTIVTANTVFSAIKHSLNNAEIDGLTNRVEQLEAQYGIK